MKTFGNFLMLTLIILMIGGFVYVDKVPLQKLYTQLKRQHFPCTTPIGYRIGTIDKRFGVSKADLLKSIETAEAIWEKPLNKTLWTYDDNAVLTVNLIYDNRQAATEKLKNLGITVSDSRASYDEVKEKEQQLEWAYTIKKEKFINRSEAFTVRKNAYEREVTQENQKGGADKETFERLNTEKETLQKEADALNALSEDLANDVDNINAFISTLNRLAGSLNIAVAKYNEIGGSRGKEFTEGTYSSDETGESIDIFQFDDKGKLIRVLAHELGHSLQLEHVEDPKAIMYRLNTGENEKLTDADLAAVKALCKIK